MDLQVNDLDTPTTIRGFFTMAYQWTYQSFLNKDSKVSREDSKATFLPVPSPSITLRD